MRRLAKSKLAIKGGQTLYQIAQACGVHMAQCHKVLWEGAPTLSERGPKLGERDNQPGADELQRAGEGAQSLSIHCSAFSPGFDRVG